MLFWLRGLPASFTTTPTKISAWNDSSGNGNHFTNGTDAQRPLYNGSDSQFGGKASARFSGSQCLNCVNSLGSWDNVTLCYVTVPVSVAGNQLTMESDSSAGARDFQTYQSGAADGPNMILNGAAGADHVKFAASDTTLVKYRRVYRQQWAALTSTVPDIYTNGAVSSLTTVTNTGTNTTVANTIWHLGGRVGGVAAYNGFFADVIAYAGNGSAGLLTEPQIVKINNWQAAEYGR